MVTAPRIEGLYAITPEMDDDAVLLDCVEQALLGGARLLQYRDKSRSPAQALTRANALRDLCTARDALYIVNDSVDLAARCAADGVHVGRDDPDIGAARARLGRRAIIGVSCYDSIDRARAAQAAGADYVAFGSVFASTVKPAAVRAPLALFTQAKRELRIPLVAIGGIDVHNARDVLAAGADALAVISALFDSPDVRTRALEFASLFSREPSRTTDRP